MSVNFGGLASGLDTQAIIDALMESARTPVRTAQTKKLILNSKLSAYGTLSSGISSLSTAAKAMDTEREFLTLSAASSDDTKATAVASSSANAGSYQIQINNLAQAERTYSDTFTAKDTTGLFGAGNLGIQVGSEAVVTVVVDTTDTLEDVASKINDSDAEVSASIVYDGSDYRLLVMGSDTGVDNAIAFTEDGTLTLNLDDINNQAQAALNASITMDGIDFLSATNQFTEMISGVTLNVQDATGADTITISVAVDDDEMVGKIQSLVDGYNEITSFLGKQFEYNDAPRTDTLMGDQAARGIKARLQSLLTSEVTGISGTHTTLMSIGISSKSDGTIEFNSAEFKEALASDPQGVKELFTYNDGDDDADTDGIAVRLTNMTTEMLRDPDGIISVRQEGLSDSISAADDRIANLERQLESYEGVLRRQFAAMEQAMAEFNNTSSFLSQQTY